MRSSSAVKGLILAAACLALSAAGASAQGQPPAKPAEGAAKDQPSPPGQPGGPGGLALTDEQRQSIAALRRQHQADMGPVREELKAAREKLQAASRAEAFDEAAVRAAALALGTAQAEIQVAQARHRAQFMGLLTPEQRERARQMEERRMVRRQRVERRRQTIRERAMQPGADGMMEQGPGRGRRMMMRPRWRDPMMPGPDVRPGPQQRF